MSRTALFVIDIQYDLCGDPSTEIPNAQRIKDVGTQILSKARSYISASREQGKDPDLDLVFVQHDDLTPEDGTLQRGTKAWELYFQPNTDGGEGERLVGKDKVDTFASNPSLPDELKASNIGGIVAFGIQSDCCVRATCKGALAAGLQVTLLKGAHSTYDSKTKSAVEIERDIEMELQGLGAKVVAWESWCESLKV